MHTVKLMITVFFTKFGSEVWTVKRDVWFKVNEAHGWILGDVQELLLISVSE